MKKCGLILWNVTAVCDMSKIYWAVGNTLYERRGDPRLYVCQAPGAFIRVSTCGSILCPFWVHFGSILGPFWVHFGSILGPFCVHFGSILGPFWVHFGSILGPFWVHCGSILGPFWVHFGDASLGFRVSISIKTRISI